MRDLRKDERVFSTFLCEKLQKLLKKKLEIIAISALITVAIQIAKPAFSMRKNDVPKSSTAPISPTIPNLIKEEC